MRFVVILFVCLVIGGTAMRFAAADNRARQLVVPNGTIFAIPAYSAGYSGPPAAAYSDPALQTVLEEVRALRADLEDLRILLGHPPRLRAGRAGADHPAQLVIKQKCAACHSEQTAEKQGKGLILFSKAGVVPELAADKIGKVLIRAFDGSMPPPERQKDFPPLTDVEYGQLIDLLSAKPRPAAPAPKPPASKPVP